MIFRIKKFYISIHHLPIKMLGGQRCAPLCLVNALCLDNVSVRVWKLSGRQQWH